MERKREMVNWLLNIGVYTKSNRDRYEGKWKNGVFHGKGIKFYIVGILYKANGEKYNKVYKEGKEVKQ